MFKKLVSIFIVSMFAMLCIGAQAGTLQPIPTEQLHDGYKQITNTTDIQAVANAAGYPFYQTTKNDSNGLTCTVDRKFYTVTWFSSGMFARGQIEYWTQHCQA